MMIREATLELAMRALVPVVRAASALQPKLRLGVEGADQALGQMRAWSSAHRVAERPLVWVHAPSVGEALMAQAILSEIKSARPAVQSYFTHLSPSAERMRERVGADASSYLPWDTTPVMSAALDALQPRIIVFVRTEIWPNLIRSAHARGIHVYLLNAVLAADSSRLRPFSRVVLQPAHERLAAIGAINQVTAQRFQQLGVKAEAITVTGDARFDQVWQRVSALDHDSPLLRELRSTRFTVVAGSTWPGDEQHLFPALRALHQHNGARLIIAPHEPTADALARIETAARQSGLSIARLTTLVPDADVVVVDRLGVLADLYQLGDIAYVGGAFHAAGVHSVVEPAALGVPVVVGPRHANAAEAQELIDAGGARSVTDARTLQLAFEQWASTEARTAAGSAARAFVQLKLGAARANAALVLPALNSGHHG